MEDEELAIELLRGTSVFDNKGRHYKRDYLEPGSSHERAARAALARLLRKEAPDGYFTQIVASLIDPPRRRVVVTQRIEFKRLKGNPWRASGRLDVEIAEFIHERRKAGCQLKDAVTDAAEHFRVGEEKVRKAWGEFASALPPQGSPLVDEATYAAMSDLEKLGYARRFSQRGRPRTVK